MLPSEIPKLPIAPPVRGFLGVWKVFFYYSLPGWVSIPNSFVSLFIFYILSYLLLKTVGCFSGCLMSSASDQKLFCEVCSVLNCSFNKFVGEKVVSPSYSSTILAPPPRLGLLSPTSKAIFTCVCPTDVMGIMSNFHSSGWRHNSTWFNLRLKDCSL